jgi:hypothetical protein
MSRKKRIESAQGTARALIRSLSICVTLVSACMGAATEAVQQDSRPSREIAIDDSPRALRFRLVWTDPSKLCSWGKPRIRQEVQSILGTAGLEIEWKKRYAAPADPENGRPSVARIVLMPTDSSVWGFENNVMGTVCNPTKRPHVYVFFPNVLQALGLSPKDRRPISPGSRVLIARALGRVIAHEVFHILCPNAPHAVEGLMMRRWNATQLLSRRFDLSQRSVNALFRDKDPPIR